jgi:hypothetical protein
MASDFESIATWLANYGGDVAALTAAGLELSRNVGRNASAAGSTARGVITGIPTADQAIWDAAGLAEIAGSAGVSADDIVQFASMLLSLGLTIL